MAIRRPLLRALVLGTALTSAAACNDGFDGDFRGAGGRAFDTTAAALNAAPRPKADDRGVISYPNYQVAVARQGDTVTTVAARLGIAAAELATYNALPADVPLRKGELLALPRRVAEPSPATGAPTTGPILPATDQIDVTTLAGNAIERAGTTTTPKPAAQVGAEPLRHKATRGETAYSIARLYNVSVKSLSDWNGLGPDLSVREGQLLIIPVANETKTAALKPAVITAPGVGSPTPPPPSAVKPLPAEKPAAATAPAKDTPASPQLDQFKTSAATKAPKMLYPVNGNIIRDYVKKKNEGIDIAAKPGDLVKAADSGTVAAITASTDQIPILVLRHANNLLTVYANVDGIKVKKGDTVKRGQAVAVVRPGTPSFVHFEVRQGFDSVDPTPYLQ
ncbi:peptidoglycan DD-metalloendopeptidase family protein [Pseudogemmobacter sp. W21_MBD1_M6]|uniref:peptidoglycan DD-metalloendopeptidase family protein n=1 Tax=Pseudogemmobacter sp. W21_MBD1_M6 TaxID=3240271 RepID=UPI003F9D9082